MTRNHTQPKSNSRDAMHRRSRTSCRLAVAAIALFSLVGWCEVSGADELATLQKYVTEDVLAVAYLDLETFDVAVLLEDEKFLAKVDESERKQVAFVANLVQLNVNELTRLGARRVYVLLRISDIGFGGPTWVVSVAPDGNATKVAELMQTILSPIPKFEVAFQVVDGAVLGATTKDQLLQMQLAGPREPGQLSEPWQVLGKGDLGLIVLGSQDSRRVVREMFPALPEPFAAIDGKLIGDELLWGGVSMSHQSKGDLQIVLQTKSAQTADILQQAFDQGLTMVKAALADEFKAQSKQDEADIFKQELEALLSTTTLHVEGTRLAVRIEHLSKGPLDIIQWIMPAMQASRKNARRTHRMHSFKQIALAMHLYEDKNRSLPASASHDEAGRPLLSWRVHILPYLEQGELYKQFHLDEPWDSKHNHRLVEKMPAIYSDPDHALRGLSRQGKTTFVVPVGKETVFHNKVGTKFREITDGTSNTILFVEVEARRAVVWTRPDDWQVDLNHPWQGVRRKDRKRFTTAFCDGSVRVIDEETSAETLRAWLTYDGGELVD